MPLFGVSPCSHSPLPQQECVCDVQVSCTGMWQHPLAGLMHSLCLGCPCLGRYFVCTGSDGRNLADISLKLVPHACGIKGMYALVHPVTGSEEQLFYDPTDIVGTLRTWLKDHVRLKWGRFTDGPGLMPLYVNGLIKVCCRTTPYCGLLVVVVARFSRSCLCQAALNWACLVCAHADGQVLRAQHGAACCAAGGPLLRRRGEERVAGHAPGLLHHAS